MLALVFCHFSDCMLLQSSILEKSDVTKLCNISNESIDRVPAEERGSMSTKFCLTDSYQCTLWVFAQFSAVCRCCPVQARKNNETVPKAHKPARGCP